MKKEYSTPMAELVQFSYREQVTATSSVTCLNQYTNQGINTCTDWTWVMNFQG